MRVRKIAGPVTRPADVNDFEPLYQEIVHRTAAAFACDGAVLRIYHPEYSLLTVAATKGDIPREVLVDRSPGEGVCGKVLVSNEHSWAVGMAGDNGAPQAMCVARDDLERLQSLGIESLIVMRLESESKAGGESRLIGTLSYFLRRRHRFSWRDVSLFRSFCQQVADTIALQRQSAELAESLENLRVQSTMMTRVEIVSLIAHDLFHKSFNTCHAINDYVERSRKALNSRATARSIAALDDYAQAAVDSAMRVQSALQQWRSISVRGTQEFGKETEFSLTDVAEEVESTLAGALARNKLTIKRDIPAGLRLFGARSALTHILFNLVINSIDAAKSRESKRPMNIFLSAKGEPVTNPIKIVIRFWDEGPGIDRAAFRDPNEVIDIGRTTKANGTGTGLPVARILLTKYFKGNMKLVEPARAMFEISIPIGVAS